MDNPVSEIDQLAGIIDLFFTKFPVLKEIKPFLSAKEQSAFLRAHAEEFHDLFVSIENMDNVPINILEELEAFNSSISEMIGGMEVKSAQMKSAG